MDDTNETDVARVLDQLLTRAEAGPAEDRSSARIAARTWVGAATHRPPAPPEPDHDDDADIGEDRPIEPVATFGIFDVDAEAERWT